MDTVDTEEKKEVQAQAAPQKSILQNKWVRSAGAIALALIIAGGLLYVQMSKTQVSIDTSVISAPSITLSPSAAGKLQEVYVAEGQTIPANTPVALVGTELIKSKVAGTVTNIQNQVGTTFSPGQAIVTMVNPVQLRVVGTIDENKGLDRIQVGQPATFTVDAFGSKQYQGIVDEISPSANSADVVFNISNARETQQFNIKVRFDPTQYPELKNGMSAKLTIFTK